MTRPTARVLALLEALQSGGTRTVSDLAARLEVNERTVRRYIEHLKDLEVPVRSVRGRYGGYRLAPGFRMPPLMLTDEEALAVLLGLIAGRRSGLAATPAGPPTARPRNCAGCCLKPSAAAWTPCSRPPSSPRRNDRSVPRSPSAPPAWPRPRVTVRQSRSPIPIAGEGQASASFIPYGIVAHSGRWYVTGADSRSGEIRSFRLDRISAPAVRPGSFEVPDDFDPAAHVVSGIAQTPWTHSVSLRIKDTVPHLRTRLPAGIATVHEMPGLPAEEPGPPWLRVRLGRSDWTGSRPYWPPSTAPSSSSTRPNFTISCAPSLAG